MTQTFFGQQMLPKCQYFVPWISKTPQKCSKRQLLPLKPGGVCVWGVKTMILGLKKAQGVYYTPPKQWASYLQYFWKNHFSNIGKKSIFFQFFPHFHKDFSKDFLTKLVKSSMFRGSILISEYLKDVLHDDTRIQQIFLQSTFSQHLVNICWFKGK